MSRRNNLKLIWVPEQCDVDGNEKADVQVKTAAASLFSDRIFSKSFHNIENQIERKFQTGQSRWYSQNTEQSLKKVDTS